MGHCDEIKSAIERLLPGDGSSELRGKIFALLPPSAGKSDHPGGVDAKGEGARAELWRRFSSAREDEQLKISRDLHDRAGQNLSALLLLVNELESRAKDPEVLDHVHRMQAVAEALGRDLNRIIAQLRPTALDDLGLIPAVTSLAEDWSIQHGVEIALHTSGFDDQRAPREVETTLYRIIEEALTNVAKHTRAKRVALILEKKGDEVCAIVEDDGAGFESSSGSPFKTRDGIGLAIMNERATLLGGEVRIESSRGRGTTIIARVPLSAGR
jgi:two-component system, NarL family, sensor histidine kinase UhpB